MSSQEDDHGEVIRPATEEELIARYRDQEIKLNLLREKRKLKDEKRQRRQKKRDESDYAQAPNDSVVSKVMTLQSDEASDD